MRSPFRKPSLRASITLIVLLFALIPVTILYMTNVWSVTPQLVQQQATTYQAALEQAARYTSQKCRIARALVNTLCGDSTVQEMEGVEELLESSEKTSWLADLTSNTVTYKGPLLGSLSRLYLYTNHDMNIFRGGPLYVSLQPEDQERFERWYASSEPVLFLTPARNTFTASLYLLMKIPDADKLGGSLGIMQANLRLRQFTTILDDVPASRHSSIYMIDGRGVPFISSGKNHSAQEIAQVLQDIGRSDAQMTGSMTLLNLEGTSYLAGRSPVPGTDWQLMMMVPYGDVIEATSRTNQTLIIVAIILLIVLIPMIFIVTHHITKPIMKLDEGVRTITGGDYSIQVEPCGTPDIDRVIDSFNHMVKETQRMMDEQYRMGEALKSKELQVLQEQINPHFLYNTLDMLHWQARSLGARDMEHVIYSLSEFYRLSLGHGEQIVTLQHELHHVKAYMQVQNIRFDNQLRLVIDVPEELLSRPIVKIVLQPLVENSIQHGIREREEKSGTILIRAVTEGSFMKLSVTDDGVGMDEETLNGLMSDSGKGYGVSNVNDRLILHYGNSARLMYTSVPGTGTTVTMKIPL